MLLLKTVVALAAAASMGAAADVGTVRAYGPDIDGRELYYGDKVAYLGNPAPEGLDVVTPVTCKKDHAPIRAALHH